MCHYYRSFETRHQNCLPVRPLVYNNGYHHLPIVLEYKPEKLSLCLIAEKPHRPVKQVGISTLAKFPDSLAVEYNIHYTRSDIIFHLIHKRISIIIYILHTHTHTHTYLYIIYVDMHTHTHTLVYFPILTLSDIYTLFAIHSSHIH